MTLLAWLDDISLDAVRGSFASFIPRLLARAACYLEGPRPWVPRYAPCWSGREASGRATVVLSRDDGRGGWRADCTCRAVGFGCEHAAELLLDLALRPRSASPCAMEVRTRRRHGAAAPCGRRCARRWPPTRWRRSWLPVRPALALDPPRYSLLLPSAADPAQPLQRRCVGYDGTPQVELKVRAAGQRGAMDPAALLSALLPPEDRAVVRLLNPTRGARRTLKASGVEAGVALEFLSRHARARVTLEGDDEPLRFEEQCLSLHLVVTRLPRHRLAMHTDDDGTPRALYGASDGEWRDAPARQRPRRRRGGGALAQR